MKLFIVIYIQFSDVDFLKSMRKTEAITTYNQTVAVMRREVSLQRRRRSRTFVVTLGDHDVFRELRRFRLEWELAIFPQFDSLIREWRRNRTRSLNFKKVTTCLSQFLLAPFPQSASKPPPA